MQYILDYGLAPGDVYAATPFLRDFKTQYPQHTIAVIASTASNILDGNPFVSWTPERDSRIVKFNYGQYGKFRKGRWRFGNDNATANMCRIIYEDFELATGIKVIQKTFAPDYYLTDLEKKYSIVPVDRPVCIINAGFKVDTPLKWWGQRNFQKVVDALKKRVLFVQVGHNRPGFDFHSPLAGARDMLGKTSLRDLAQLVYHADFVLSGVSQLHHVAGIEAYKPRHCITISGAREPENWANCWKRENVKWHWIANNRDFLPCMEEIPGRHNAPGCWKRTGVPIERFGGAQCTCWRIKEGIPECMDAINPERVINIFEEALK